MVREEWDEGSHRRARQLSRRIPAWPVKSKRNDPQRINDTVAVLVEMESSCVLDMVENDRSYTLEETGEILQVTRERARQIEVKGLLTIRRDGEAVHILGELGGRAC
jgi:hypothetical protein